MLDDFAGDVEYDSRLLSVIRAAVDLRPLLVVSAEHIQRYPCSQFAVVRRHKGAPRQITPAGAVHLYAAHLHPIGKRLDVLQVMKTGARFLCALPLAAIFSFEPRCGLILKGGKPYRIQRFAGRYAVSGRRLLRHGILDAQAPQQFAHIICQILYCRHIDALRLPRANAPI